MLWSEDCAIEPDPTPKSPPLVSVVIPVFNTVGFLAETVASLSAQTLTQWEAFLIDDGSDDGSVELLMALMANDPRLHLLFTTGRVGPGPARNQGIQAAQGRYVAFLDADDLWHPRKLELQVAAMRDAQAALSCTGYLRHNLETGRQTVIGVPERATRNDLLKANTIACSSAMYDRNYFGPRQMPAFRGPEDFAFWLALLRDTPGVLGVPLVLMTYRQHRASLSAQKSRAATNTWWMYRNILRLPLPTAAWYFGHYALHGFAKHRLPRFSRWLGWLHNADWPERLR